MKKNIVQNVVIHMPKNWDDRTAAQKINEFHSRLIEQRLREAGLPPEQKIAVINEIIRQMKCRETGGTPR